MHWARLICALQAAEHNQLIANDPLLTSKDIRNMNLKGYCCGQWKGHKVKTLILGMGNPILSDDDVGIHVASIIFKYHLRVTVCNCSCLCQSIKT